MTGPYDPNGQQFNPYGQPSQFAPPQYAQAPQQAYAAPQYAPQQGYQQPPAAQLVAGSLDAYFSQPSTGGGAALKFEVGTTHIGFISRVITNADVQQQTQPQTGHPQFYKDGRPKFVMKIPMKVQPSQTHPEGQAQWYCAGGARDELMRAMAEAGAPEGPPEAGALVQVTCTGTRPAGAGFNPAKVYSVVYRRPEGAPQAPAPAEAAQAPQPAPPMAPAPAPMAPMAPAPGPLAATPPVGPQQPQPAAVPPVSTDPASGLDDKQRALLAQLQGQPQ